MPYREWLDKDRPTLKIRFTLDNAPPDDSISIAGISNDQTEAATITPEAKPSSAFCSLTDISPFIIKTKADPSMVPSKGMSNPIASMVMTIPSMPVSRR